MTTALAAASIVLLIMVGLAFTVLCVGVMVNAAEERQEIES